MPQKPSGDLSAFEKKSDPIKPHQRHPTPASVTRDDTAPRPRSLTLKLSEVDYQRLRRVCFDAGESHQAFLERAALAALDAAPGGSD